MNFYWFHALKSTHPKTYKIFRKLGNPFLQMMQQRNAKKRNMHFKENARTVFSDFCDAFSDAEIDFWLTFGTLLGAVREHDFIAHDMDIDVGVFDTTDFKKLDNSLRQHGFHIIRKITVYSDNMSDAGFEITYGKDAVSIDIFVFTKVDDIHVQTHDFLNGIDTSDIMLYETVRKITLPMIGFINFTFLNKQVKIPQNYTEYLSAHYGSSFMIPDPTWSTMTSPVAIKVPGSIGVVFK